MQEEGNIRGIIRQTPGFNPYGEIVIRWDESLIVQMSGKVTELP